MSGGFSGQRGGFTHWQFLPLSGGTVVGAVTFSAGVTMSSTLDVTGAVTLSSTLAVTGAMTLESTLVQTKDAIGTGATAGNTLRNTTAAAAGAQQYSPMIVLTGAGWKTDATAATQVWDWAQQNRPVEGAAASTSALHWLSQVAGGGYTSRMNIDSAGHLSAGTISAGATTEKIYIGAVNGYPGIWFGNITPTTNNFNFLLDASFGTLLNAPAGQTIYLQSNNTSIVTLTSAQLTFTDAVNIAVGTTTGTKIGLAATQKLGFWNTTPVVQPAGIANADGTLADITTKFNTLITALETLGLIATV